MDGLKKAADSMEYSIVKYEPISAFCDALRSFSLTSILSNIGASLAKCFSNICEIFLCRWENPLSNWLMAIFTSFSGIASTFLIISADLTSSKYRKRAITLVGSGENINFFLVTATCMVFGFLKRVLTLNLKF